ncbi:GDSL esterase/lipase At1g29670-like [Benincasa hispida]|uniref:GDSL esterase/lipase At1g29670-like n=1 Tax=Benincasa hispida TaxID=102211 RepID=UPI001900C69D|nr:GDSL esterase/lipase At1g29670-like [Benincasa hispida]
MKSDWKYLFVVYVILLSLESKKWVLGEPKIPCYFIFGDSLVDNGNNNLLITTAKANYKPYGIDFPKGATGRFSNGRNLADFIAEYLKFPNYIPPFKNTRGFNILQGVNYASGAAGIRQETGQSQGQVISFDQQLRNHNLIISRIRRSMGNNDSATTTYLKRCLYLVGIGSNDYLNNYYMPFSYPTSRLFTPQDYAIVLTQQLSSQLKTLYGEGGRKIAVFGLGIIGCTPYARATFDTQGSPCVENINNATQLFNIALKPLIQDLNAKYIDAKFTFIDVSQISTIQPPNQVQLVSDGPCCEVQPDKLQCVPFGRVCGNRNGYTFWDGVHPTEVAFEALANRSFNAQFPNDTYPYDINQLVHLNLQ